MEKVNIITAEEAAKRVKSGDTITTSGFVASCIPEALIKALEKRYLETGDPKDLTLVYAGSQGNRDGTGGDRFSHEGFLKRIIIGHFNTAPKIGERVMNNELEAYNIPQGTLVHMFRDMAAHKPFTLTSVGLQTFVDPRNGGARLNAKTTEELSQIVTIDGHELICYKNFPVDVAFIRGTYADEFGNVTVEKEVGTSEVTSVAQMVKNNGGTVIVQVEQIVKGGSLDPRLVKIPGIYVSAVVVAEDMNDHRQTLHCDYDPTLSGAVRAPETSSAPIPLTAKKVIGRRATMELKKGVAVNLGIGVPEYVAIVAGEEGISDTITLTVESGAIGGVPQGGIRFGSARNPDCILDQAYQFDFYDGGGLDFAYLGLAQADEKGNINVSKFGPRLAGCGGFINITQNAKNVIFCGTFTTGGLDVKVENGALTIVKEGRSKKFLKAVEQVTFSGDYANDHNQNVLYMTERCIFKLEKDGLHLIEIAPGIDLQTQILDLMDFAPIISPNLKVMDEKIFLAPNMGLKDR